MPPYPTCLQATVRCLLLVWVWVSLSLVAQPWDPKHPARGEALARQYCQGCHLFPAPDLLDKKTWSTATLRRMAPMLGAALLNLDNRPDGAQLKEARIFPEHPLLPEADWIAISHFYLQSAPDAPLPQAPRPPLRPETPLFQAEPLSLATVEPAVTLVHIDPAQRRLFLGDARRKALHVVAADGRWLSSTPVASAPVGLTYDRDLAYLTLIGDVFPSDLKSGQVVSLHASSHGFTTRPVLADLRRPVHALFADLNSDGLNDLIVAQFGNYLGQLSAFMQQASGPHVEEVLVDFPGAIRTEVRDINRDGRPDLVTLFGQAREGIYHLRNRGNGGFGWDPWLHFPPAYGSTSFELVDFNDDGHLDILYTNGDNGDYPSPFKHYHGIRLFLNDGQYRFTESWFYPLNGAFKAVARDFDHDGDLDIAAISFFPDYTRTPGESFVYLDNHGNLAFTASSISDASAGRWLTMDAGDLDGDGDLDLVLGSFIDGPRTIPIPPPILQRWQTQSIPALILRNRSGPPPTRP